MVMKMITVGGYDKHVTVMIIIKMIAISSAEMEHPEYLVN